MSQKNLSLKLKPDGEDFLRAFAYISFAAWSVLYWFFTPTAFSAYVDPGSKTFWLTLVVLSSIAAAIGAVTKRDLKVELPAIVVMCVGPVFYSISQLFFVASPGTVPDPANRIALLVYALIPAFLLAPRIYGLFKEYRRQGRIRGKGRKGNNT